MDEFVSKCVLRVEVKDQHQITDAAEAINEWRGRRHSSEISVETFPIRPEEPLDDWGLLPKASRGPNKKNVPYPDTEVGFFSGNPFVEVTKGVLHLYKEDALTARKEASTLCLLGVPASLTCHDLLEFTASCHRNIAHMRVLRDSVPNQYMALLTFRSHESASEFYNVFNGHPYNSLETDKICRIVWVSQVQWAHNGVPPAGHTELPTCPVCLERMDESVDGVLTIQCNHAFHANCLEQWSDTTCPVCRFVQSPEQTAASECEMCENERRKSPSTGEQLAPATSGDTLWICLICGHIGCGRYQNGHAAQHYRDSNHCYAMQLNSHRVWDYKGDNFVHRLLQNKADGKLVPTEGPPPTDFDSEQAQQKVDAVQLEFTHMLTSQLDEQRSYFEDKLAKVDSKRLAEVQQLQQEIIQMKETMKKLSSQLATTTKEKATAERKLAHQIDKLNTYSKELEEERQLGQALRTNQKQWQQQVQELQQQCLKLQKEKDKDLLELQEQVRDLMVFIEARNVIEKSGGGENLAGGSVSIPDTAAARNLQKKHRKKR